MKDIEWLKNEVKSLFDEAYESGKMEYYESEESIHRINSLIDQLDEPETLSQEWIDENKVARINNLRKMTTSDVVPVEKLKNLLVPKQDKPFIPQFVVDWIEKQMKFGYEDVFISMTRLRERAPEKVKFWFRNNSDTYARAWLDGYEVEKEKMYYIYDKSTKGYLGYNADKTRLSWYTSQFPNDVFTEQEIKSIDERYWAFAEEVAE